MGVFFLCEVGTSCESKDVQETNVTSSRVRIATSTIYTIFHEFLHYLPPRLVDQCFYCGKIVTKYVFSFTAQQNQTFDLGGGFKVALW
jgi:hypothetical protein